FHAYLTAAREQVTTTHGRGLFVDLHGHGHQVQRLELGYLLYEDELAWSDAQLNSTQAINWSSLRHLATNNQQDLDHADLLRGPQALGTRLAERGYPSVPSQQDPFPLPGQPYFSGGYNTVEHSSYLGGSVDGVQVECNFSGVRDTGTNRTRFADSLRVALEEYLTAHFFGDQHWLMCSPTALVERPIEDELHIAPTLVVDLLHLTLPPDAQWLAVMDVQGRTVREWSSPAGRATLDLSGIPPGTYTAVLQRAEGAMQRRRFVKQ
ncbi:MAG: T9SS type A sorting domain-containing protein, partial [Flavobacteriales bacterium]|nr:T9SS type A sorting domain-containing protein [Flavobacteriales bacterium]